MAVPSLPRMRSSLGLADSNRYETSTGELASMPSELAGPVPVRRGAEGRAPHPDRRRAGRSAGKKTTLQIDYTSNRGVLKNRALPSTRRGGVVCVSIGWI